MEKYVVNGQERPGPLVGLQRKIKTVQTNAIQFEPHKPGSDGSWLQWPKASQVRITGPDTFVVAGEGPELHYRFVDAAAS
jgi:hypothetical protein